MAAINDLISQIQDAELRERIQKEVNKLSKQKKFGLVFEEHMPECTPLYDMPIKRGCNVMLRDSKEDKSVYRQSKGFRPFVSLSWSISEDLQLSKTRG